MSDAEPGTPSILWLGESNSQHVDVAGGKGASLSRMRAAGVQVPPGFVVPPAVFARFIAETGAKTEIETLLAALDPRDADALAQAASRIHDLIVGAPLPADVAHLIGDAYSQIGGAVAVRSSAIAEDSSAASYAGQQETFLDVTSAADVIARVRDCWASFFSAHAIFYRHQKGSLADRRVAVVVQKLIAAEKAGVMFTADPVSRRRDRLVVEAVWGLGETLVSGRVTPDNYQIARADGRVIRAFVPEKEIALSRDAATGTLALVEVPPERRKARVLTDDEIGLLVGLGVRLEQLFGGPQDVEWAIEAGALYALQSRPVTTLA